MLVALGENAEPKALPVLLALADSPNTAVRRAAIRALGMHRSPESLAKLVSLLRETDKDVLMAACAALGRQKERTAVKPLVELIERSAASLHDNDVVAWLPATPWRRLRGWSTGRLSGLGGRRWMPESVNGCPLGLGQGSRTI